MPQQVLVMELVEKRQVNKLTVNTWSKDQVMEQETKDQVMELETKDLVMEQETKGQVMEQVESQLI